MPFYESEIDGRRRVPFDNVHIRLHNETLSPPNQIQLKYFLECDHIHTAHTHTHTVPSKIKELPTDKIYNIRFTLDIVTIKKFYQSKERDKSLSTKL